MIIDAHTDVLCKYLFDENIDFYKENSDIKLSFPNMLKGNIDAQIFAIFIPGKNTSKFNETIKLIDFFYEKIQKNSEKINIVLNSNDIENNFKNNKKNAILSIEGAEAIEGDLGKLRTLYRLGVRAMGLTWNFANEVADGIMEGRGGGLTDFGFEVISEMNRLGMMIDVSHLSEKGFWDVVNYSKTPIMASHSNAKSICNHPRNLSDNQIKAIIKNNGMIGVTYVRDFTSINENPTSEDLILHINHIVELGGINNIGLGSDFDGAHTLVGLDNAGDIKNLINVLKTKYDSEQIKLILGENWYNYFKKII